MDAVVKSPENSSGPIEKVILHPRIVLRIVNHHNQLSENKLRAVGVLLGSSFERTVDVSNSYAVPFKEDDVDPSDWFLDGAYVKEMLKNFNDIHAEDKIVGWYSTAPKLQENDLDIHRFFHDYDPNPVLVLADVRSTERGVPIEAYCEVEEVKKNKKKKKAAQRRMKVFVKVASDITVELANEMAYAFLLANARDTTIKKPATEVSLERLLFESMREMDGQFDTSMRKTYPVNVVQSPENSPLPIEKVIVRPLVLQSINRLSKKTHRWVIGVLLGSSFEGTVNVSNSYAVPFKEDTNNPGVWSLDYKFVNTLFFMSKKINAEEQFVGWYRTGPTVLDKIDLDIHGFFHKYAPNPVLVLYDVRSTVTGTPPEACCDVENPRQKGHNLFVTVALEVAVDEVEKIGLEHPLRAVKRTTINTPETEASDETELESYTGKFKEIIRYLEGVMKKDYHANEEIILSLRDLHTSASALDLPNLVTKTISDTGEGTRDT